MPLPVLAYLSFMLLLIQPLCTNSQTYTNISLGASLTAAQGDTSFRVSESGDFAFGFREVISNGFLLAIWFNKIPDRTIVWSANRNRLVLSGSKAQLNSDGEFVLLDQSGRQIWNANPIGTRVSYAAILNSGNFVLAANNSAILWQSFEQPTDTLLPTQSLGQGGELIARYSATNYSNGRFSFMLQSDGNLSLSSLRYPFDTPNTAYWPTPDSIGSGHQVTFNQTGYIVLVSRNGTVLNSVFSNPVSNNDFFQRATIDYDGVLRQYVYPKNTTQTAMWPAAWTILSFVPSNICTRINQDTGPGVCGFNSYCMLDAQTRPSCQCPPGYSFLDPNDESRGCKQNFVSQNCDEISQETGRFKIVELLNADWPRSDYESFSSQSEDWCREACLNDCYCVAARFRTGNCWKKRYPLSNGKMDAGVGGKTLIKVRKDNSTSDPNSSSTKKDQSTPIIIGSVLFGSSVFLNLLALAAVCVFFSRLNQQKSKNTPPRQVMTDVNPISFSYQELERATGGFTEELGLGQGAFGTVYKGVLTDLDDDDEQVIAVKRLDKLLQEGEHEFNTEVKVIGRTNHKNLVQLLGFCDEGQHRLLVYQYMRNGSLANLLFRDLRPNWYSRMQISFGIARGLLYLHEECSSQIIHCDIKPQNILLDETFRARISDFGLAKLMKTDQTRTTTAIRGTKGYVAPEWFKSMPVTAKVDVYSFGILLLELVCCRRSFERDIEEEDQMVLADWAYDCYKEGKLHLLVKDDADAMDDMKKVERFLAVALWCIQEDPSLRPPMKKVVQMLEGGVQVSTPPDPASFISSSSF